MERLMRRLNGSLSRSVRRSIQDLFQQSPLDLRFALQKTLDPRITFTRASSGTFVDSAGVLQTAVTNLLLRSEEFDNASWLKLLSTVSANAISAPNGTTTADKLEETSGTGEHIIYQGRTGSSETLTLSVFCKQAERTRVRVGFSNFATEGTGAIYDLASGSVVSVPASGTDYTNLSASISAFGNGWFRCVFTATKGTVNTINNPFTETVTGTSVYFAGTAGSGIYIWGAQLEQSSTVGEYIPTTSTINSAPRFDHNPTTGESLGLLVEEARTNLLLNSGTLSTQSATVTAVAHTLSFTGIGTITLTGTSTAGPLVGTGIGEANRVSLTFTPTAGSLTLTVSGTVTNAQLEAGAFRTSYIATAGATATRAADVASITGSAFSSWYRQDEGTVFVDGSTPAFTNTTGFVAINAAGNTNRLEIRQSRNTPNVTGASVDVIWTNINATPTLAANTSYKQATAVSNASHGNSIAGSLDTSSTVIGTIAATQLFFGIRSSQTAPTGGSSSTIRRLTYWPQRLANSTLQSLTQ
jgi:hypothetical protein